MVTVDKFLFQFGEQLKGFVSLEKDQDMQCFIIDGNRFGVDDILSTIHHAINKEEISLYSLP